MTESPPGISYQLKIKGQLRVNWSDYFGGFNITYDAAGNTLLTGRVVDQTALRGLLCQIWDLNLEVISIIRDQEETGHVPDDSSI